MKTKLTSLILVLGLFFSFGFKNPDSEFEKIFPGARIEIKNVVLSAKQAKTIETLSGIPPEARLVSFYIAKKGNEIAGYGYIDTHIVRVHPETVL